MKKAVILPILFILFGHTGSLAQPGRTVLTRGELERAGVLTLNDIFELTGQWTVSSVDGFTLQYSSNGLAGPGRLHWPVFLNDIPLNINVWGTRSLNKIPVDISQIDSVIVVSEPRLVEGYSMEKGGLFIYTRPHGEGLEAGGQLWTGNRSGDPGPFVYTDRATPNLERLGPIASASMSYSAERISVYGGVKRNLHYVSDPIQSGRILPFAFGDEIFRHPKIELGSFYLRGTHKGKYTYNELQAGLTDMDDMLYTELYGTEIPADTRWSFISLNGRMTATPETSFRYRVSRNRNEVIERANKENRLLRWDQKVITGQFSMQNSFQGGKNEVGIAYNRYALKDRIENGETLATELFSLFNHLHLDVTDWLTSYTDLMVVKEGERRPAFKSLLNFFIKPAEAHRLTVGLSYSERLPAEDNSLWFWVLDKGFGGDTLVRYTDSGIHNSIRLLRSHISWRILFNDRISLKSKIGLSRYLDEYGLFYTLVTRDQRYIETGSFSLETNLDATELMIPLELVFKTTGTIDGSVKYTWTRLLAGTEDLLQRTPEHRFHTRLNWKPVNSFNLWTKIHIRSGTEWSSVRTLDGQTLETNYSTTDVTYRSKLPSTIRWDAGFNKKVWNERVAFKLQVLNLLNEKYREHPLGPRYSFTIFLGMEVGFSRQ